MTALDSRTWLVWGMCCMVPLLIGRHPLLVATMLCIVLAVRIVCIPSSAVRWGWIVRIALVFAAIGVLFNALTVRSGNQVAFHIPLVDWPITWNAIVYGVVSGVAMITLVFTGITTAAGLNWIALTRVLPPRLAPLAVSGSVAWSFLPAASQSLSEIREAQAARGHQIRSGRDVLPIMVPLLDSSLSRALTMSETLEARGFGAAGTAVRKQGALTIFGAFIVLGGLLMAFALSAEMQSLLWPSLALFAVGSVGFARTPATAPRTTRYREHRLQGSDAGVISASLLALIVFLVLAIGLPDAVIFNPYPNLEVPAIDYRVVLAMVPLLAPALFPYQEAPA